LRFESVALLDDAAELFDEAVVAAADDAGEQAVEHWGSGDCDGDRAGAGMGAPAMKKGARGALLEANAPCTVVAAGGVCKGRDGSCAPPAASRGREPEAEAARGGDVAGSPPPPAARGEAGRGVCPEQ